MEAIPYHNIANWHIKSSKVTSQNGILTIHNKSWTRSKEQQPMEWTQNNNNNNNRTQYDLA